MLVPVLNLIACIILCFRKVFTEKFNIALGYPRKDTCSTCDAFEIKLKAENLGAEEMGQLIREKELHVRKGQVFYDRKSTAGQEAKRRPTSAALAFDFSKKPASSKHKRQRCVLSSTVISVLVQRTLFLMMSSFFTATTKRWGKKEQMMWQACFFITLTMFCHQR